MHVNRPRGLLAYVQTRKVSKTKFSTENYSRAVFDAVENTHDLVLIEYLLFFGGVCTAVDLTPVLRANGMVEGGEEMTARAQNY